MAEEKKFKLQGHLEHQGLHIAVENRKGSVRSGVDKDGHKWRTVMKHPYGYIKGTKGADGEEVDAYVGPKKDATHAYVVHQHKPDGKGYDEDKVMLGFASKKDAVKGYLKHYDDPKFLGPVSEVPMERLKELVEEGKPLKKISSQAFLVSPGSYVPQGMSEGRLEDIRLEGQRFKNFKKNTYTPTFGDGPGGVSLWKASMAAMLDEAVKLGSISDEQARAALDRYETLERNKPTAKQVARYATIGAVAAPAISAVGDVIHGKPVFGGSVVRGIASKAVTGALGSGAIPLVRAHLDRKAEMGTLRDYMKQHEVERHHQTAGNLAAPYEPTDVESGTVSKLAGKKEKDSGSSGITPARPWDGNAVLASFEGEKQAAGAPTRGGFLMASEIPPFRAPSLRAPVEKVGELEKASGVPGAPQPPKVPGIKTPAQRFSVSRRVGQAGGAPKTAPGLSVKDQTPAGLTGLPGARKTTIGKWSPKMTPTMPEAAAQGLQGQ